MKKILLILLFPAVLLYAGNQQTGTTTAGFLKIGIGSRMIGMAEAYTAVSDDPNALCANIAGLGKIKTTEISISHVEWIMDLDYEFLALTKPVFRSFGGTDAVLGLGISFLHTKKFKDYGEWGQTIGDINFNNFIVTVGYGQELKSGFKFGFDTKIIGESIYSTFNSDKSSYESALTFDAGIIYSLKLPPFKLFDYPFIYRKIDFGVSIENIPSGMKMQNDSLMPLTYKLGIASEIFKGLLIALDFHKPMDNRFRINLGTEIVLKEIIAFRIGYRFHGYEVDTFTAGIGFLIPFKGNLLKLDVAYAPEGIFKQSLNFSAGIRFAGAGLSDRELAEILYYKGIYYYTNGKLNDAIAAWEEALKKNPSHEMARKKIEEAKRLKDMKKMDSDNKNEKK